MDRTCEETGRTISKNSSCQVQFIAEKEAQNAKDNR